MSGSADVLISLGINIKNDISNVQKCLDECGICFLFAPKHHSAMKHVMNVRKELHFRTIFNLLGPLSNPAFVKKQLVGVYDKSLLMPLQRLLKSLDLLMLGLYPATMEWMKSPQQEKLLGEAIKWKVIRI